MITKQIQDSINSSVLCWLATVSRDGTPNVSPKEAFLYDQSGKLLIANIASPKSVTNIDADSRVCVSFIDVFTQKGYKILGDARILKEGCNEFEKQRTKLHNIIGESFKIISVIEVLPKKVENIIAPSYRIYPERTERDMITQSLKTYRVEHYQRSANKADDEML